MKYLATAIGVMVLWCAAVGLPASAQSLQVKPLKYDISLTAGEKKQGFVDIYNPSDQTAVIEMSVEAFRQIDNQGTLQFYDSSEVRAGVTPDLDGFELLPREALRLYFHVDAAKLPTGDVFAALMATSTTKEPTDAPGTQQSIRVGTLINIVNQTPGGRDATVTRLNVPFLQLGDSISGTYTVKNSAPASSVTGFYPTLTASLSPLSADFKLTSSLIYAGKSRTNPLELKTNRLGLYKLTVAYEGSSQSQWLFVANGLWAKAGLTSILFLIVVAAGYGLYVLHRRRRSAIINRQ